MLCFEIVELLRPKGWSVVLRNSVAKEKRHSVIITADQ